MSLLKLSAPDLRLLTRGETSPWIARVVEEPTAPDSQTILLARDGAAIVPGFRGYFVSHASAIPDIGNVYWLAPSLRYLRDGDVVRVDPLRRTLSTLYRRASTHNTLLLTERCSQRCLMCSQPPKDRSDQWLVDELEHAIPLFDKATRELGISGGEPTLLGDRLLALIRQLARELPSTAVHLLTNGRAFARRAYARALSDVKHPDLMLGVPLYSHVAAEHDFIVQSQGAFDETIRGVLALCSHGVAVELRTVVLQHNVASMPELARFIARNLCFVNQVAIMGMEPTGYARHNFDELFVDPSDASPYIVEAAATLRRANVHTMLYNFPLCVLAPELQPIAQKSISDWKNSYLEDCDNCARRDECCGFFSWSAPRRPRGITAFR